MSPRPSASWKVDPRKTPHPLVVLLRHLSLHGLWLILWMVGVFGVAALVDSVSLPRPLPVLLTMGVSMLWLVGVNAQWRRRNRRRVAPLMADPCPLGQYPVEVLLYEEGQVYGKDEGIVSFVDGWMHYEGIACSFSLSRNEVKGVANARDRYPEGMEATSSHPLRVLVRAGEVRRVLVALANCGGARRRPWDWRESDQKSLWREMDAWRNGPQASGIRPILPPLEPHPTWAGYYTWLYRVGGGCFAVLSAILGAILLYDSVSESFLRVNLVVLAPTAALAFGAFRMFEVVEKRNRLFARKQAPASSPPAVAAVGEQARSSPKADETLSIHVS